MDVIDANDIVEELAAPVTLVSLQGIEGMPLVFHPKGCVTCTPCMLHIKEAQAADSHQFNFEMAQIHEAVGTE